MTTLTYINANGAKTTVDAQDGDNVMQTALANDVEGVIGECGGSMMCATCHCYVDEAFADKAGVRMDGEDEMLECATSEVKTTSRLSCQIVINPDLEGLVVHLPGDQI